MVVRWNSADELDLNALIFDTSANFKTAAYLGDREKMNGMIKLTDKVEGGASKTGNEQAITIDWGGLSKTDAGFVAIVLFAFAEHSLMEVKGCKLSCE